MIMYHVDSDNVHFVSSPSPSPHQSMDFVEFSDVLINYLAGNDFVCTLP
jgi:hypothetical protein